MNLLFCLGVVGEEKGGLTSFFMEFGFLVKGLKIVGSFRGRPVQGHSGKNKQIHTLYSRPEQISSASAAKFTFGRRKNWAIAFRRFFKIRPFF